MISNEELSTKPIKIKLFASAREIVAGKSEIVLQSKENTIKSTDLRERILQAYPELNQIPFVLAINYKIMKDKPFTDLRTDKTREMSTTMITGDDEIALLPPISGG
jgi:molybdopterin converting factor small subunit